MQMVPFRMERTTVDCKMEGAIEVMGRSYRSNGKEL